MGREENITVFNDTKNICKKDKRLVDVILHSNKHQKVYLESDKALDNENIVNITKNNTTSVVVSKRRSFEAAARYKGTKVGVLNFASASYPGGGVRRGSSAQEESLCRCSTLYFNLYTDEMYDKFYGPHRKANNPLHNGDIIYTPDVCVFKSDTHYPMLLPTEEWMQVDVITCAAPNLKFQISDEQLQKIHEYRFERILKVAYKEGCDVVILGAFGCGAFHNDPKVVARAAKKVVDKYKTFFKTIEFAIYCTPRNEYNYHVFRNELSEE